MKKLFFTLFLVPTLSFAFDTSVKGFIALDALNYEKIQSKKGTAVIGIGVLDLKIFAEQDNMSAAMKLDLDGNLTQDYNLFEEAYASYRGIEDFKISLGKGVVKFQNLHWGVVENTYLDGGSILGTENSVRKLSKKAFASVGYGGYKKGFLNIFTIWGDSTEVQYDQSGNPVYTVSNSKVTGLTTKNTVSFSTETQIGFANKFELYKINNITLTQGLMYYKHELQEAPSYAIDFGFIYDTKELEIWSDLMAAETHKSPYEKYTTKRMYEVFWQVGAEYTLDEKWSLVENAEALFVNSKAHDYSTFSTTSNSGTTTTYTPASSYTESSGNKVKTYSYKVESGVKYKLSKSAFLTVGGLYERKVAKKNGIEGLSYIPGYYNTNKEAFKLASTVAFWF